MKLSANDIRVGHILNFHDKLWVVLKTQHTKPGKGGAYMQVEMKGLLEGGKTNHRFRSSETVEKVSLEEKEHQYLYYDGENYIFMDPVSFEQVQFGKDFIGDSVVYLKDNMMISVLFYEEKPISIKLPDTVVMEVREADAVVKGQTASSSYKPAVLENNQRVLVPPHIEAGMRIVVNTADGTYVEREKD
ncbi:MAG: elongation factor P [Alphaproteobacteria bacterium]|nr:MAG: elongation factor P [Alphaproteobacteria bacterium]